VSVWLTGLAPALATAVAVVGRRRLPAAASAGLFVTGLSALLLQAALGTEARGIEVSATLLALAVLWMLVGGWVERKPSGSAAEAAHLNADTRRCTAELASMICTLAAWPALWLRGANPSVRLQAVVLALVTGVVLIHYLRRRQSAVARLALLAPTTLWLVGAVVPSLTRRWSTGWGATLTLLVALGTLGWVVGTVLAHWRRRVAAADEDPDLLLEARPRWRRSYAVVVALSCLVGAGGIAYAGVWVTPVALALAALAVLSVGPLWRTNGLGALGLLLTAETTAVVPSAWLSGHPVVPLTGVALGGAYMLWLARFWQQQLADGRPWTTAGRLVPAARRWAYVAAAGTVVLAAWPAGWPAQGGTGVIGFTLVVLLALWSMLVRDPRRMAGSGTETTAPGDSGAASAACFVLIAVGLTVCRWLEASGATWLSPAAVTGAAALLLALRVRAEGARDWPYGAFVMGVAPAVAGWLLTRWAGPGMVWQVALTVVLVGGAIGVYARGEGGADSLERQTRGADATC